MTLLEKISMYLPEVAGPTQKKLAFKEKLKWTTIILIIFFALGLIPLVGLGPNNLQQFEFLSIILGASFGSILSLGIGPIVTASIVLQLLNGSGLVKFYLSSPEGKKRFGATQKILAIAFTLFEAFIYVMMGGLAPDQGLIGAARLNMQLFLVLQLFIGGMLILFMDEVIQKWGFGSGVSLFIAAGVSKEIFIRAFSPLASPSNPSIAAGAIPALFQSLAAGDPQTAGLMAASVLATVVVFLVSVYAQSMKVEIPLSFGRVRGQGIRWPLRFLYTSNIPVILIAALLANIQLWASLLQRAGHPILGTFAPGSNAPTSGLVLWIFSPNIVSTAIRGNLVIADIGHAAVYMLIFIGGSILFSYFWVQTSGMDARSQAEQIMSSGLSVPGFRRDIRVMERLLARYIGPLTIMGAIAVGILAALADISGALSNGTGILLTVMIIYQLYEEIAKQHMMDMNPAMRKFIKM